MTPWAIDCQAPLSMGFSRQEHWSGLPFSPPGDLPDPGIKSGSSALQADFFFFLPSEPPVQLNSLGAHVQFLWESFPNSCGENTEESFGLPGGSDNKESASSAGDMSSIPGLGRSPGEGNGNPLQYSCLENSMDRRA